MVDLTRIDRPKLRLTVVLTESERDALSLAAVRERRDLPAQAAHMLREELIRRELLSVEKVVQEASDDAD